MTWAFPVSFWRRRPCNLLQSQMDILIKEAKQAATGCLPRAGVVGNPEQLPGERTEAVRPKGSGEAPHGHPHLAGGLKYLLQSEASVPEIPPAETHLLEIW